LAKYEAKGRTPPKNWQDKYQEPEPVVNAELPELPEGWAWIRGEQLFGWSSGKFLPKKKQKEGNVPVYGGNGCCGYHNEALVVEPTICIGRVGAHCGNVQHTDGPTWITDNAIYATLIEPSVEIRFAAMLLGARNLNELARGGGQPYVNQDVLNNAMIPLPPKTEQLAIVETLETVQSISVGQWEVVNLLMANLDQLDQSILAKAFRGELVPQDPQEEPAAVLLERIRQQREAAAQNGQPKRKTKRTSRKKKA
ncbi:MAG: restriction endonuclease subunit S, partial [Planctomycetaceae bacterium]|nr:restriction endonuclease subunit S [Planctomycetaceae bacterium]